MNDNIQTTTAGQITPRLQQTIDKTRYLVEIHFSATSTFREPGKGKDLRAELPKVGKGYAILIREELAAQNKNKPILYLTAEEMKLDDILYEEVFKSLTKERQLAIIGRKADFAKKAGITL